MTRAALQPDARPSRYRIGAFEFDTELGELVAIAPTASKTPTRLAPKPAQLLRLLIEKDGELLSHDEIREQLWPDVQVEFDQSVHYCVRQIRSALGDSAGDARYVQTLPRRGYRLMVAVEQVSGSTTATPGEPEDARGPAARSSSDNGRHRHQRVRSARATALGGICVVLLAMVFGWSSIGSGQTGPERVRLAIMPMTPPDGSPAGTAAAIATHLVALLGNDPRLAVIGPTTTVRFSASRTPVHDAASTLTVTYIINGRFTQRDGAPAILTELIRTSDGAHIWVQLWDVDDPPDVVAETIAAAFAEKVIHADTR